MRIRTEHLKLGYVILSMFFSVKKNDSFKTFSGFGESQLTGPWSIDEDGKKRHLWKVQYLIFLWMEEIWFTS